MTGEIITIQVGQCGNHVGKYFWNQLLKEHGIDKDGYSKYNDDQTHIREDDTNPFFKQITNNRYVPRAIMIDLEPAAVTDVQSSFNDLFNPRNTWVSSEGLGAGNSWSTGYDRGVQNQDRIMDIIDRELDSTDNFEGFQLLHSVAGGTGSGLGSSLLEALTDRYSKSFITTYSVFPSKQSEVVVGPYNTVLTLRRLCEDADASIIFDNNALLNLTARTFRDPNTSYEHTNQLISSALSSITNSLRFPSYMYNSMASIFSTLIPTPELHFLTPNFTPFTPDYIIGGQRYKKNTAYDVLLDLLDPFNSLVTQRSDMVTHFNVFSTVIGEVDQNHILRALPKMQQRLNMPSWSTSALNVNIGRRSPYLPPLESRENSVSGLMLSNTSAITSVFERSASAFDKLFYKGAFLNQFESGQLFQNGLDEFVESREVITRMMEEYSNAEQDTYLDDILNEDDIMIGGFDNEGDS
ncbi:Tubulin/FtsZ family, GTPase domain [Nakaseomyces glabratus]|nr:Tubulin/FtsZ family, GTPase domain [Nakaseomyces glabratus]KAH7585434.1 Tubulin/FtsZ family, GTPase domain [Nakaseomyces glabratus]KTB11290.1 Tubulin gamma chain [Nakaseomyces glabratus]KTB20081.1 Tubulin gamma chain [Nakaseomyces glabratus]